MRFITYESSGHGALTPLSHRLAGSRSLVTPHTHSPYYSDLRYTRSVLYFLAVLRLRIAIVRFDLFCVTVAHRSILGSYIVCASSVHLTPNYHTSFANQHVSQKDFIIVVSRVNSSSSAVVDYLTVSSVFNF